jgi:hypothetical protein
MGGWCAFVCACMQVVEVLLDGGGASRYRAWMAADAGGDGKGGEAPPDSRVAVNSPLHWAAFKVGCRV